MTTPEESQPNGASPDPEEEEEEEEEDEAEELADFEIRAGVIFQQDLVEQITDMVQVNDETLTSSEAHEKALEIILPRWEARLRAQESWPEVTDADKVALSFINMGENQKIVPRINWACCTSCGVHEIKELAAGGGGPDGDGDDDEEMIGYVFFHQQDMERVLETENGEPLYLTYGSFTREKEKDREVGETVFQALRREGLRPVWDGTPERKIELPDMIWQKRLPEVDENEDESEDDEEDGDEESIDGEDNDHV